MTRTVHAAIAAVALATLGGLGGCLPDTITPLSPTDGEPPARDQAMVPDESWPSPEDGGALGPADGRPANDAAHDGAGDAAADDAAAGDAATDGGIARDGATTDGPVDGEPHDTNRDGEGR